MAYHIALLVHLLAFATASGTAALVHFAEHRRNHGATVGEVLQWHGLMGKTARVFPFALLVLILSGGYMVSAGGMWSWSFAWVRAALTGAVLIGICGGMIGGRARKDAAKLVEAARANASSHIIPPLDRVVDALAWCNTATAIAVASIMTIKPGLTGCVAFLVAGYVVGLSIGLKPAKRAAAVSMESAA
ncbi:MAG TPA: hypothetical protein VHB25_09485 [Gemmatimonadaceae bacterium]|nr:hypothetical protein [Gemmatimonadaceae bacterium]